MLQPRCALSRNQMRGCHASSNATQLRTPFTLLSALATMEIEIPTPTRWMSGKLQSTSPSCVARFLRSPDRRMTRLSAVSLTPIYNLISIPNKFFDLHFRRFYCCAGGNRRLSSAWDAAGRTLQPVLRRRILPISSTGRFVR